MESTVTVQTVARTARTRLRRVLATAHDHPDRSYRLPLHTKLFLVAHDDETGRPYLGQTGLCRGLAAAILLELWLTGRVQIGWRYDARSGLGTLEPGLIRVLDPNLTGDPLTDAALRVIWRNGGVLHVRQFVREFATPDLSDRVRAYLVASGTLRRKTRRRWLLFRSEGHVPTHTKLSVRARSSVRDVVNDSRHPQTDDDHRTHALAGLVTALGLTRYLPPLGTTTAAELDQGILDLLARWRDPAIRDVTAAVATRRHRLPAAH
jgi:hypothetical protein